MIISLLPNRSRAHFRLWLINFFPHTEFTVNISSKSKTYNNVIFSFFSYFGWYWLQIFFQKSTTSFTIFFLGRPTTYYSEKNQRSWGSRLGRFGLECLLMYIYWFSRILGEFFAIFFAFNYFFYMYEFKFDLEFKLKIELDVELTFELKFDLSLNLS